MQFKKLNFEKPSHTSKGEDTRIFVSLFNVFEMMQNQFIEKKTFMRVLISTTVGDFALTLCKQKCKNRLNYTMYFIHQPKSKLKHFAQFLYFDHNKCKNGFKS